MNNRNVDISSENILEIDKKNTDNELIRNILSINGILKRE